MRPDIVIPLIQKLKTLTTCEECQAFKKEFDKYAQYLDSKEVSRVNEEILTQMIKIKGWGR